jgi:hypothetical protein
VPFCAYNTLGYREEVKGRMQEAEGREEFASVGSPDATGIGAAIPGDRNDR